MKRFKSLPTILILTTIFTITILSLPTVFGILNKSSRQQHSNIVDMQYKIEDALNNGDIIVSGKVKNKYSYKLHDVVFTNYVVSIDSRYKKYNSVDIPNEIEVRVTGGNFEGNTYPYLEDVQDLTENDKFLFILKKVYPDQPDNNFYAILGGDFQGAFKLNGQNAEETIAKFNPQNKLEKDILNKKLNDVLNIK